LPHLGIEKKACQYRVLIYVRFELLCTPFARVIAGSYKKGTAAHHCELEMYVCSLCDAFTEGSTSRSITPVTMAMSMRQRLATPALFVRRASTTKVILENT